MDVLSLISTKGGAGKTTVAANLGGLLADAGLRVLLLDLASQPTLSSYYGLREAREAGSYELIAQGLTTPELVISATVIQHLHLIVSNDCAGHINTLLLHAADGRLRLRNLLSAFEDQYDVLIIDTQGARSVVVEMVILATDCALCPVPPEMLAARELRLAVGEAAAQPGQCQSSRHPLDHAEPASLLPSRSACHRLRHDDSRPRGLHQCRLAGASCAPSRIYPTVRQPQPLRCPGDARAGRRALPSVDRAASCFGSTRARPELSCRARTGPSRLNGG